MEVVSIISNLVIYYTRDYIFISHLHIFMQFTIDWFATQRNGQSCYSTLNELTLREIVFEPGDEFTTFVVDSKL